MEPPTPKHILLVEDNLSLGAMLLSSLQSHQYEVVAVTAAESGMRVLEHDTIDLIILDILLPHMSGLDFLKEIREKGFTQPIIVVSNMGDAATREKSLSLGATYYLVKSNTSPSEIIHLINLTLSNEPAT
jgi:DNA-binding response OmpR family regulator